MTDRDLAHLHPQLRPLCEEWLARCKAAGLKAKVIVTARNSADQNAAKAAGLSNASAGASPHNVCDAAGNPASCAFDYAIFTAAGAYVTDGTDPRYREAGEIGKKLGLAWGGDWLPPMKPDWDHLQLPNWRSLAHAMQPTS